MPELPFSQTPSLEAAPHAEKPLFIGLISSFIDQCRALQTLSLVASGGGIHIACRTFQGNSGAIVRADGGNGQISNAGGGGGGRIAIWYGTHLDQMDAFLSNGAGGNRLVVSTTLVSYAGSLSVTNGTGYNPGQPGTAYFLCIPTPAGTVFVVR